MTGGNQKTTWLKLSRRAVRFISPHRGPLAIILFLAVAVAALGAFEPIVMKLIFDRIGSGGQAKGLGAAILLLVALDLAREGVGGVSNWLTWKVRLRINAGLLDETVGCLHRLPLSYYREESVGGIMTKLDRGINGFVGALSELAFNVFPGLIYLVISLFLMFTLDARLSLMVLFFTPVPALIGVWAAREQTRRDRALMERWSAIFSRFNEVLSGILIVKSFVREEEERRRFITEVEGANSTVLKGVARDTGVGALKNTVAIAAKVAALSLGGYLALNGSVTAGTLVAFLSYLGGLFGPVQGLTGVYQTIRRASVSLEVIFSILDAAPEASVSFPAARPAKVESLCGEILYDKVCFSYNSRSLLDNIDIRATPGQVIALVGPSGAGKTTLVSLLQRFYSPTSGSILIDGMDSSGMDERSLREHIGFVSQDPVLFNDTIRNNIAYGRPSATLNEIEEAARAANAHEFTMRLQRGYDTLAGERGGRLSAGERQRISIARALIKDPPILILDEATSSLDAESEALVHEALSRLMSKRTSFVIAHRLSTVVTADNILVLKDGRITESGRHEELMGMDGYYRSLVMRQTSGLLGAA